MNAEQMNAIVASAEYDNHESPMNAVGVSGGAEAVVVAKPQPKKRQLKQMKPIKVSRSPSPKDATERFDAHMDWSASQQIKDVARGIIPALSEEQQQQANDWLAKQQEQVVAVAVAEEKTLAEIVAELSNIAHAQEQRIAKLEAEKSDAAPKPKGYYQVADGEEELYRTRIQNANLRKEIEAKTKTNQMLQQQLEEDPNELTRLKEINKSLRKENEGLTNTNKSLKAQLADSTPELTRQKEINATLRKEAEAERRLKLQYKTEKTVMMSQIEKYLAILAENGIVVAED